MCEQHVPPISPYATHPQDQSLLLAWRHASRPEVETQLQYSHWRYRADNRWLQPFTLNSSRQGPVVSWVPVDIGYETRRDDLELQQTLSPATGLRLVLGAGARRDTAWSPYYFDQSDWMGGNLYRLFAHAEWRFARQWLLNAGDMWERHYLTGAEHAPR
jgi:hypothetical protein